MNTLEDSKRIYLLEALGWKDLRREGNCMRGTSPEGKKNHIPPNPLTNLNVWPHLEDLLDDREFKSFQILLATRHHIFTRKREATQATPIEKTDQFIRILNTREP